MCQFYDPRCSLPLALRERKEWRFAATRDVLTLRFAFPVVKLSRLTRDSMLASRASWWHGLSARRPKCEDANLPFVVLRSSRGRKS